MISLKNNKDCCGCNACGDVCPKKAISFQTDIEGFWYPVVDPQKCVHCGLCDKVCPVLHVKDLKKNDLPQSICYAAENKNLEVVFDSTSGGLFSALADVVYRDQGYVGGAVFNEDFSVRQFISPDRNDLPRLRSSKYLQSSCEGFYLQVQDLVQKGEKVLVCGTPCQMAALRSFLRKDYDNLLIVDFICRGINSPKVWRKYLDTFEERYGSKVVYCKAKSKEYGWRNLTQKVILENGKHLYETKDESNFTKGYLHTNAFCRPSCYECPFKGYPRMADITLADFWGVEKLNTGMEKNLGTSLVMINSQKGATFFERVKSRINFVPVPFESIEGGNRALTKPLGPPKVDRKRFFEDLEQMSFLQVVEKYTPKRKTGFRHEIKEMLKYVRRILQTTQCRPAALIQLFRYNTLSEILHKNILLPTPYCLISIAKGAKVHKKGITILGRKYPYFKRSRLETRLSVAPGGTLSLGAETYIGNGSEIEVFPGGTLTFESGVATNVGFTVVCGNHIAFGKDVKIGRNVTVRDNNGAHYINRQGYKNSKPVLIGDKVWLCEACTVMNGVRVGDGAIVGAKAFVIRNVPAHSMVSGHPAEVIDEDILWKY